MPNRFYYVAANNHQMLKRDNASVKTMRSSRREGGFTLIELSAVILIVAVLVSLISAALDNTRKRALQISCLSNLKQLQWAWTLYVDDNDQMLPLNRTAPGPVNNRIFSRRSSTNSWVVGNPREDTNTANIKRGSLFPYLKSAEVYRCPMDNSRVSGHAAIHRTRSYSMSSYLNGDHAGVDPRVKTSFPELINPPVDKVFVFIEEHQDSIWAANFVVLPKESFTLTSGSWNSTPADLHQQGCNLTFADGHVEHWRWHTPKEGSQVERNTRSIKELNDLRRLQSAVPY